LIVIDMFMSSSGIPSSSVRMSHLWGIDRPTSLPTGAERHELEQTAAALVRDYDEHQVAWTLQIVGERRVDAAAVSRAAVYLRKRAAGTAGGDGRRPARRKRPLRDSPPPRPRRPFARGPRARAAGAEGADDDLSRFIRGETDELAIGDGNWEPEAADAFIAKARLAFSGSTEAR
jgi:hypothetical protein